MKNKLIRAVISSALCLSILAMPAAVSAKTAYACSNISMSSYVTQPSGTNSCGAHAIAYYLWEKVIMPYDTMNDDNNKNLINDIYQDIQFDDTTSGMLGFGQNYPNNYSNPFAMVDELNNTYDISAQAYVTDASPLKAMVPYISHSTEPLTTDTAVTIDASKQKLKHPKYSIIICAVPSVSNLALHYILIKNDNRTLKMLDSASSESSTKWIDFTINNNGSISYPSSESSRSYLYTNAGIILN